MRRIVIAVALVCFAAATAAAQTKVSGTFLCDKPDPILLIPVGDRPDHGLGVFQIKCTWTKPMVIERAKSTDVAATINNEVIGDTTGWHGFFVATMDSGDKAFMSYQGAGERKDGAFVSNK